MAELPAAQTGLTLPPLPVGTGEVRHRMAQLYPSIAAIFEAWVRRLRRANTQRAYRQDVMPFVTFLGFHWPGEA